MRTLRQAAARLITVGVCGAALAGASPVAAQRHVTSPRQHFGHDFGDDYWLVNYTQLTGYWRRLATESDRIRLVQIGTTGAGRPMVMAIISAPANLRRLDRYREISARLARGDGVTETEARSLVAEGKAVVWIDGGLHADETLGTVQLGQLVYELASQTDAETERVLRDVIVLAVPANPDGMEMIGNWYMRRADPAARSLEGFPRLYNRYVGHDDNRDAYMASQPETRAMDSVLYRAWYPQVVYDHHQTAPAGTVMASAPYRDPFNYHFDPLVPAALDLLGGAMLTRFAEEGKPGVTVRTGAAFSAWWNGGLRTTAYFHNMLGILTETIGSPTPVRIPVVPDRLLPSGVLPDPVFPGVWHFAQSVAYASTANRAVLDFASRHREELLLNAYRMAHRAIARGSGDAWTLTPSRVAAVRATADSAHARGKALDAAEAVAALHAPAARDPRGYVIPSDQPDFLTATKFVNALIENGVTVLRATRAFAVGGKTYPANSYVVRTAQAFRAHVLDMFEPQEYPGDAGGRNEAALASYDNAGWTLAFQMGVRFDRVLDAFDGPFVAVAGLVPPPPATVARAGIGVMLRWSGALNDAFAAATRLLRQGDTVWRDVRGDFYARPTTRVVQVMTALAAERGVATVNVAERPAGLAMLRLPRVALWDVYGGSTASGWTRFVLDEFEIPYEVVYAPQLDAGDLRARYDVLILPDGALVGAPASFTPEPPDDAPPEWKRRAGRLTLDKTLPAIRAFLEDGGVVLASGSATMLVYLFDLPIADALVDSLGEPFPRSRYYVPGSVLSVRVDASDPIARGMGGRVDVMFDDSPVFRLLPGARAAGVTRVAWFDSPAPLRSGLARGQRNLDGTAAVVRAAVGKGTLVLYGPAVNFRGQSHGTFKLLFNGIYLQSTK